MLRKEEKTIQTMVGIIFIVNFLSRFEEGHDW